MSGHPPPNKQQQHRRHLISQSLYDETLIENSELFDDLTPDEAVAETCDQFISQGMTLDHLVLSHPDTDDGRRERAERAEFEGWLEFLDGIVSADGTVNLIDDDTDRSSAGGGGSSSSSSRVERTVQCLEGIERYCRGGAAAEDDNGGYPYLNLIRSTDGIYTLMSLLGAVVIAPPTNDNLAASTAASAAAAMDGTTASTADTGQQQQHEQQQRGREKVLRAASRTLTSILAPTPPSSSSKKKKSGISKSKAKEVKSDLRDSFVAFDRLVGLIGHYTDLLAASSSASSASAAAEAQVEGAASEDERSSSSLSREEIYHSSLLTDLADLATAACRGCEKNKVAYVQARKRRDSGRENNGGRGGGGIGATMEALSLVVYGSRVGDDAGAAAAPAVPSSSASGIGLLTSLCRLITVLCRFDDFRNPSDANGGAAATAPGDMTVSSAHDNVLEFHRQGVVPVLHRVTGLALDGLHEIDAQGGDEGESAYASSCDGSVVPLAVAVLSATRALAVNDEIVQVLVAVGTLRSAREALAAGIGVGDVIDEESQEGSTAKNEGSNEGAATETPGGTPSQQQKQRRALAAGSLGLLRNLCGNDEIKTNLCLGTADGNPETSSVLPTIVRAMRTYRSDPTVQEHGCATLAAMALRRPANAVKIVEEGGPVVVMTAMRRHPYIVPVQRQGSLAVRNVVARLVARNKGETTTSATAAEVEGGGGGVDAAAAAPSQSSSPPSSDAATAAAPVSGKSSDLLDVRETFLDLGAESVLRDIAGKHQGSVDEAYAALRDLGCKVSMVRYETGEEDGGGGGRAQRGVTMFGDSKPRFNPVFEESGDVEQRIARQAAG